MTRPGFLASDHGISWITPSEVSIIKNEWTPLRVAMFRVSRCLFIPDNGLPTPNTEATWLTGGVSNTVQ